MNGADANEDVELLQEAEEWDQTIAHGTPAELEAFARWLHTSPRHVEAYLRQTSMRVEMKDVDAHREFDLGRLLAGILEPK